MWKTLRFFKSLLGFKTTDSPSSNSEPNNQLKRRWSFRKSRRGNPCPVHHHKTSKSIDGTPIHHHNSYKNEDPNKHATALAAATAAVVDAAVAAAQAAAVVVRITVGYGIRDELAAIKIQSCFRAYLARRALRALKALVKLQAVVRGHILRKQTADMMRRLQALIRAQARARMLRSRITTTGSTTNTSSHFHHHGPPTPEKVEQFRHTKHDHRSMSKRNGSRSYARGITGQERMFLDGPIDNENDNIVEVDTDESHILTSYSGRKLFQPDQISFCHSQSLTTSRGSTFQLTTSSPCASCEMNYFDDSMRRVSTPVKSSDGSRSCISSYSNHPNYMAKTESSRAKVRSLSAPRIRSQVEVSNATKRVSGMQRVLTTRDSFAKKTYNSGSGQLGLHVYDTEESEFCDGYWN